MLAAERRDWGSCELFWLGDGRWSTRRPLKLALAPLDGRSDTTGNLRYNGQLSTHIQRLAALATAVVNHNLSPLPQINNQILVKRRCAQVMEQAQDLGAVVGAMISDMGQYLPGWFVQTGNSCLESRLV